MEKPLVSIITPCYNSQEFVSVTILSVINQTYQNWELLITDDGSNDESINIIEDFIKSDKRIKLFKIQNSGPAVARNHSISKAQGTFIAFLDSDDIWKSNKLDLQINFMLINDFSLTYTSYEKMNENGDLLNETVKTKSKLSYNDMLTSNKIGCLTAIYNQRKIGKVYMPIIKKRQDYALWLSILKTIPFAHGLNDVLAVYRIRESSVSSKKIEMLKWNWKVFYEIEKLGLFRSSYYLFHNVLVKIFKR